MADKVVKTPEYWKEELFQPQVETTTHYGTKVKVPENLMPAWRSLQRYGKKMLEESSIEDLVPVTWKKTPTYRNILTRDLRSVYFEIGVED